MSKIEEIPLFERPREKAWRFGISSLSNNELLAIIIGSGTKNHSAIDIADDLLSFHNGLGNLGAVPYQEFLKIQGINKVACLKLGALFEIANRYQSLKLISSFDCCISDVLFKYQNLFKNETQEVMAIIVLNRNKKVVYETILYKGSENNIAFSFRDIYKVVFAHNGYSFYLIHNHPNGVALPSENDIIFTRDLIKECKKIHLKLIDHLIIAKNDCFSFSHYIVDNKNYLLKKDG